MRTLEPYRLLCFFGRRESAEVDLSPHCAGKLLHKVPTSSRRKQPNCNKATSPTHKLCPFLSDAVTNPAHELA
ncbi:hypothetical protein OG21DRAFT_1513821 [Imleria badia]|nr:hypothetical protein OG21DRAFT_1513821 [Imleria badia]